MSRTFTEAAWVHGPSPRAAERRVAAPRGSGFTIIELLVVISILVIVALIALPSFTAMLYAQEDSLAQSLLRAGMRTGRDTALRTTGDDDSALVFFFTDGRIVMVPCVRAGVLNDKDFNGDDIEREVFVPTAEAEAIQLPPGWSIRGYAPPGTCGATDGPFEGWYSAGGGPVRHDPATGNWVFPETDFYDQNLADVGEVRHTFMIRFRARTGEIMAGPLAPVLVVSPRPSYIDRGGLPGSALQLNRLDYAEGLRASVRAILLGNFTNAQRRQLIGRESSDVVMAGPVTQLAVYDERALATAMDATLNKLTRSLYRPSPGLTGRPAVPDQADSPTYVVSGLGQPNLPRNINRWIMGDTDLDGLVEGSDDGDEPVSRLYMLDRYGGALRPLEVQP